jgi:hypothetical protein
MAEQTTQPTDLAPEGKIPDLWGDEITVNVLPPLMILNAQAELLQKKTQGVVFAQVTRQRSRGVDTLSLDLLAPAVHGFRERVLGVRYHRDRVYPAAVTGPGLEGRTGDLIPTALAWGNPRDDHRRGRADNQEEFIHLVGQVLKGSYVRSLIHGLVARSNEARATLPEIMTEYLDEVPEEDEPDDTSPRG